LLCDEKVAVERWLSKGKANTLRLLFIFISFGKKLWLFGEAFAQTLYKIMLANHSRIKNLLISLLPIIIFTIFVIYKIQDNVSLADLKKTKKTFNLQKEENEEEIKDNNKFYSSGLEIKGNENFKKQITQALKLIWLYDRDTFYFIKRNVFEIRNENRTTFYLDEKIPVIAVSEEKANQSPSWVAGIIVHNAWHAYYELGKKRKKMPEVPPPGQEGSFFKDKFPNPLQRETKTLNDLFDIEEKASLAQIKILQEIGAPPSEIKKIVNRKKDDFSLSHDGNYIVNP